MLFQYRCVFSLHQVMIKLTLMLTTLRGKIWLLFQRAKLVLQHLTILLLLGIPILGYAASPIGVPFRVNTNTAGHPGDPVISNLTNGGFVIVWSEGDPNGDAIYAQRYHANGTPDGDEFQVNSDATHGAYFPSVSSLSDGGFVIVWDNGGLDPYTHVQRYQADGSPNGAMFLVNTNTTAPQYGSTVSNLSDGGFVIAWGESSNIYAQRYQVDGSPTGAIFQVNTNTMGYQHGQNISGLINGSFVIAWDSSINNKGIYAQRYQANGTPDGAEFQVNTDTTSVVFSSSISKLTNGGFIITWLNSNPDVDSRSIHAQRYQADGSPDGAEFLVHTDATAVIYMPTISSFSNGGTAIAWMSRDRNDDDWEYDIYAQSYHPDGSPNGVAFLVNSDTTGSQGNQGITGLSNGDFVIIWESMVQDGDSYDSDIYAQRYRSDESVSMTLAPLPQTLYEGEQVSLDVIVSGHELYGIDGMLTANEAGMIRFTDSQYGDFFAEDKRIGLPSTVTDTQWQGALTLMEPAPAVTGSGTFATVSYVAEQVGTIDLTLTAQFSGQQGQLLLNSSTDYSITVKKALNISGNVASLGIDGNYDNVRILINGQVREVEADGSFHLKTRPGEVTIRVEVQGFLTGEKQLQLDADHQDTDLGMVTLLGGDCNGDNSIDIADLTMLLAAYRSQKSDGAPYTSAADFNRDNQINIQDLSLLGSNFGKQGPQSW
ncbi:hypothetical protein HQQ94_07275 [Shewanella sp. VB17]|uniref:dockerin type I domain-containing protein n=1 Tax=Shewanella sp. VB17 TaxID=2739432 RepID=UPI0015673AE0|nr:dockerin type I domain-containing protein [Shewanella sp. VB17]NRD73044.1 hypothetical protein [Shewanella sp. VB17]